MFTVCMLLTATKHYVYLYICIVLFKVSLMIEIGMINVIGNRKPVF